LRLGDDNQNFYRYGLNNPIICLDPSGLFVEILCEPITQYWLGYWRRAKHCRVHVKCDSLHKIFELEDPTDAESVIMQDPDILSGQPVFCGARVPFQALLDYLEGGDTLDEFLEQYPGVSRGQAIAALEEAKALVLARFGK